MLKLINDNEFLVWILKIYNMWAWNIFRAVRIFAVYIHMVDHLRIYVHKVGVWAVVHSERVVLKVLRQIKVFYFIFWNICKLLYDIADALNTIWLSVLVFKIWENIRIKVYASIWLTLNFSIQLCQRIFFWKVASFI